MRRKPLLHARDALDQLLLEHGRIRTLLRQYDRVRLTDKRPSNRAEMHDRLCDLLILLAHMEEDFFTPPCGGCCATARQRRRLFATMPGCAA